MSQYYLQLSVKAPSDHVHTYTVMLDSLDNLNKDIKVLESLLSQKILKGVYEVDNKKYYVSEVTNLGDTHLKNLTYLDNFKIDKPKELTDTAASMEPKLEVKTEPKKPLPKPAKSKKEDKEPSQN